jgi:hypothetical protein
LVVAQTELAWAAGFFDGEGYVGKWWTNKKDRKSQTLTIRTTIHQAHPEVLRRFASAVGVGKVRGPFKKRKERNWSPMWEYQAACQDTLKVADRLIPYLSPVKVRQFKDVVSAYTEHKATQAQRMSEAQRKWRSEKTCR